MKKIPKKWLEKDKMLVELFNAQIEQLKRLNCPESAINVLRRQERRVVKACHDIRLLPNRIPFIPVITPAYCKADTLMSMVRHGGESGDVYSQLIDGAYPIIQAVGSEFGLRPYFDPYYALNVEDGTLTKGLSQEKALKKSLLAGRSPLTAEESISLCIFTDVLSRHYLWIRGSICSLDFGGSALEISEVGGRARLNRARIGGCEPCWATPSCGMRIGGAI